MRVFKVIVGGILAWAVVASGVARADVIVGLPGAASVPVIDCF